MNGALKLYFGVAFLAMNWMIVRASMSSSVWDGVLQLLDLPWGVVFVCATYLSSLTFYIWIWQQEKKLSIRLLWLVLILFFNFFAITIYFLRRLFRLNPNQRLLG